MAEKSAKRGRHAAGQRQARKTGCDITLNEAGTWNRTGRELGARVKQGAERYWGRLNLTGA